jgi:hypothetical protein
MKGFVNFILVLIFLAGISISAQIDETISCVNDYINSFQGKMVKFYSFLETSVILNL